MAIALWVMVDAVAGAVGIRLGEQPSFETIERIGVVEIRRYGPRLVAETTVDGADSQAARSEAFSRLAGYIFGGNRGQRQIAMTSPVQTGKADQGQQIAMTAPAETAGGADGGMVMRFFLPAKLQADGSPEPNDQRVTIRRIESEMIAVLRFSGSTESAAVEPRKDELLAVLEGSPWAPKGKPVSYFYDPPFTPSFLKRNEVAVPVERR